MGCRTIKDPVESQEARVSPDGSLHVQVQAMPAAPVETTPVAIADGSVTTTTPTVNDTSGTLVGANLSRRQLVIQNRDPTNPIYILLASSGPAVIAHYRLGPGESWSSPCGVNYTGAVQARTSTGTAPTVVMEFVR